MKVQAEWRMWRAEGCFAAEADIRVDRPEGLYRPIAETRRRCRKLPLDPPFGDVSLPLRSLKFECCNSDARIES